MPDRHTYQFSVSDIFCSNQRGQDHDTDTLYVTVDTGGLTYQSQFDLGDVRTGDRIPGPFTTQRIDVVDGDDVTVHWAISNFSGSDAGEILGDVARVGAAIVAVVAAYAGNMVTIKDSFLKATEVFADSVLGVVMGIGAVTDFLSSLFTSTLPDCRGPVVDVGVSWAPGEIVHHLAVPESHPQVTSRSPSGCGLDPHTDFTTNVAEVPVIIGSVTTTKVTKVLPLAGSPPKAWDGTWGDADFDETCRVLVTIETTTSPAFSATATPADAAIGAVSALRTKLSVPDVVRLFGRDPVEAQHHTTVVPSLGALATADPGPRATAVAALPPQRRVDVVEREAPSGGQQTSVQQALLIDVPMATTAYAGAVFAGGGTTAVSHTGAATSIDPGSVDFVHRHVGQFETISPAAAQLGRDAEIDLPASGAGRLLHDVQLGAGAGGAGLAGAASTAGAGALAAAIAPAPYVATMVPQPGITLSLYGCYDDAVRLVDHRIRYTRRVDGAVVTDVMLTQTSGHVPR